VVVEALALDVVVGERHAEAAVDPVQVVLGEVDKFLPQLQRGRIAALQVHHPLPGPVGESRVGLEFAPGRLVKGVRVGPQQPGFRGFLADVEQVLDEHAELGAPVADVVVPDHPVACELQDAGDGVAHDRGAQVPDVHLLGDVRRGVLDHHRLRRGRGRQAEPAVTEHGAGLRGDPVVAQGEVDEAGPADRGLGADAGDVEPGG